MRVRSLSKQDKSSTHLTQENHNRCNIVAENYNDASKLQRNSCERMDSQEYENRHSVEEKKFAIMMIDTVSKFKFHPCFKTIPLSLVRIVNGVDKCVTESMLTKKEEDVASGKPVAERRPRQKPTVTLTSVSNSCS